MKESQLEEVMVEWAKSRAEFKNYQVEMATSRLEETIYELAKG